MIPSGDSTAAPATALLPVVVPEALDTTPVTGTGEATTGSRPDRTERLEGERNERGGRRSRRGGRRRRREPGEAGAAPESSGGQGPDASRDDGAPGPQSFDFEPAPATAPGPAEAAPPMRETAAMPAAVAAPRPEWTPTPPSDATREAPRSEP